jgi:hypothetical protein
MTSIPVWLGIRHFAWQGWKKSELDVDLDDYPDGLEWVKNRNEEDWGTYIRRYDQSITPWKRPICWVNVSPEKITSTGAKSKSTPKKRSKTLSICYKRVWQR